MTTATTAWYLLGSGQCGSNSFKYWWRRASYSVDNSFDQDLVQWQEDDTTTLNCVVDSGNHIECFFLLISCGFGKFPCPVSKLVRAVWKFPFSAVQCDHEAKESKSTFIKTICEELVSYQYLLQEAIRYFVLKMLEQYFYKKKRALDGQYNS